MSNDPTTAETNYWEYPELNDTELYDTYNTYNDTFDTYNNTFNYNTSDTCPDYDDIDLDVFSKSAFWIRDGKSNSRHALTHEAQPL